MLKKENNERNVNSKAYTLRIACFEPGEPFYFNAHPYVYQSYEEALNVAYRSAINESLELNMSADPWDFFDVELDASEYLDEKFGFADIATVCYDKPQNDRLNDLQYRPVTCYQVVEVEDVNRYSQALIEKYNREEVPIVSVLFAPVTGDTFYTAEFSNVVFSSHKHVSAAYDEADHYCKSQFVINK